jgi:CheY-like chemotaxis protein
MMKPYGARVDCAGSGPQAIAMIKAGEPRYDAIFMDHMMPGMDGIEAARIIREEIGTDYARGIPIIALTANAIVGSEKMFLESGFQDFISKPIDMAKLDAVLRRWVKDKGKEQERSTEDGTPELEGEQTNSEASAQSLAETAIAGINVKKALERFNSDEEILADVLRSYARNTRPLLAHLTRCLEAEDLAEYAITVHGVKGSSYGICAQEAGEAAEALEAASKTGDLAAVRAGHPAFIQTAESLLDALDIALGGLDKFSGKPAAEEPDPALLAELREACKAFDAGKVDGVMARLEGFRYERGERLVEWLRERVEGMEYEAVADGDWPKELTALDL